MTRQVGTVSVIRVGRPSRESIGSAAEGDNTRPLLESGNTPGSGDEIRGGVEQPRRFGRQSSGSRLLRTHSSSSGRGTPGPVQSHISPGRRFTRLDDGIEFDRGSKWARFRGSMGKKINRAQTWVMFVSSNLLRKCGFMVDNVDLIRATQRGYGMSDATVSESEVVLWHNIKLGTASFALMFVTALEPVLLKVMSDHALVGQRSDYRYVLCLLLIFSHLPLAIGSGIWYAVKYSPTAMESCDFPKTWFVLLALLNALHMLMLFIPSAVVPGPLTVLLVHGQVPFTYLFSMFVSAFVAIVNYLLPSIPDPIGEEERQLTSMEVMLHNQYGESGDYQDTNAQMWRGSTNRGNGDGLGTIAETREFTDPEPGLFSQANYFRTKRKIIDFAKMYLCSRPRTALCAGLICIGITVGVYPVFTRDGNALGMNSYCYAFSDECKSSTTVFLLSALPAALSAICLERTLVTYSVPVAPLLLHAWLVPMQLLFGVLLAPFGRHLQHPTRPFLNISTELKFFDEEFANGLKCILLGKESGVDLIGFEDPDWCKPLLPLVIMFVTVSFSFHMLTLYVMKRGTEVCLRLCTAIAVPFGWSVLAFYDLHFQPHVRPIVPTEIVISWFNKLALVFITCGILFHKTVSEPGTDYILTSPIEERDRELIEEAAERHRQQLLEAKAQSQLAGQDQSFSHIFGQHLGEDQAESSLGAPPRQFFNESN